MKNKVFILALFISIYGFAQNKNHQDLQKMSKEELAFFWERKKLKIDSLSKIDFLSRNYKHLDSNFNISISKELFDTAVEKYKFIRPRIRKYRDSLSVVLAYELDDEDASRIAKIRIGYTWLRFAYHIWLSEKECEKIGRNFGFTHPYRFKEFLVDDTNKEKRRLNFIDDLKKRMKKENSYQLDTFPNTNKLLNFALLENPIRKKAFKKKHKKH
ncbi:hypothetical protein [Polaribacter porphyrae]|uniref:Uncharacterized protein n=1 Tax=Polaribacter porphyrae TaxID=1137780 RepID=A0A2S7WR03_9FLAO|nr:hypothetical protein [Polaribacter porphyrae]PQJ80013.1 hypothetical protein BTO18_12900 [Polaribacter porphyrae]